ncbi:S24/S26 family peptidase [Deinococcus humi]|uniref:Repressor LexA n=1 Tax=Deinococcus humi TaxID=662880 RepID=A0A7W8JQQ1_9DEIO|nr:S24/S26 family peptidase [Deinococcus humi]MBB5361384.1 repressor LexA [Deinococcus humi]
MAKITPEEQERAEMLGRVVRKLREDTGLNRPDFTAAMSAYPEGGVKPDYINKLESGTRSLSKASPEVREAIRLTAGVSAEDWYALTGLYVPSNAPEPARPRNVGWVFEALGIDAHQHVRTDTLSAQYVEAPETIRVPVRGLAAAGRAFYSESNLVGYVRLSLDEYNPSHEIVRISGDSMHPTLRDGDHVAVDPSELELAVGRVYVFHIIGDGHCIKRVERLADGQLWLVSDNRSHPPIRPDEVEVRGRAVRHYPQVVPL